MAQLIQTIGPRIRFDVSNATILTPPKWAITQAVEHCMYYASGYYNFRMRRLYCYPNDSRYKFMDYVYMELFAQSLKYLPKNIPINVTFTFMWNFLDFFIMAISLGLATRFQQFSYVPDAIWYKIRREHIILCEFMEHVNDRVSTIILLSSLNNMYFICNNLLNIFTKLRYPINYAYFWFSLFFLLGRTICVFMFASQIYDAAMKPLNTLKLVPTGCWTEEVQRFRAQILNEYNGLTGKNFYWITRKSLFGEMMATIATYEFMLLQFDSQNSKKGLPNLCD
ncbi:hypothetical protein DOY81_013492 [Sarcophaga bullata]|nr:hypothetical protein DOY81_013492 [Sarcophaga bullata]